VHLEHLTNEAMRAAFASWARTQLEPLCWRMIEAVLPSAAAWSEVFDDPPNVALFAEEQALVANAVDKRRREFTTGRVCARTALAKLGIPAAPILRGERGAPLWPPGVVGSIAHCVGYRAAAVAPTTELVCLGIDAEPNLPLDEGVVSVVARPDEMAGIAELAHLEPAGPSWDRLVFCAKEALYKAWFPLTGRWLGFEDATITIDPVTEMFEAHLLVPGPDVDGHELTGFRGRWLVRAGLIIVATAVPARRSESAGEDGGVFGLPT
jgi:4'-phosphopantetheinyl transferase EntD